MQWKVLSISVEGETAREADGRAVGPEEAQTEGWLGVVMRDLDVPAAGLVEG